MSDLFTGDEIVSTLLGLGVTHVVWLPDSVMGRWESALMNSSLRLIRVCREGEAWPLAAGLILGGMRPVVVMQTTGLFESGDALRNVLHELRLPVFAIVGARSWLVEGSTDTAKRFTLPVLNAWDVEYRLIDSPPAKEQLAEHYRRCQSAGRSGIALVAEGRR